MREPTYYQILGLELSATAEEIKSRFRELARQHHPDVNPDKAAGHQTFIQVTEAYRVLIDPRRRTYYDLALQARLGSAPKRRDSEAKGQARGEQSEGADAGTGRPGDGDAETRGQRSEGADAERSPFDPAGRPDSRLPHTGTRGRAGSRTAAAAPAETSPFGRRSGPGAPAVGARVEVDFGATVVVCRVRAIHGSVLHLAAPSGTRHSVGGCERVPVTLRLSQPGSYLEAQTWTREWVWMRPPVLVVGPVDAWRESPRRRSRRIPRSLTARLTLDDGRACVGRTENVSAGGASLIVTAPMEIAEGTTGRLTVQIDDRAWCDDLPFRVTRVRHWLRAAGRTLEIAGWIRPLAEEQRRDWQQCLARLGIETDE